MCQQNCVKAARSRSRFSVIQANKQPYQATKGLLMCGSVYIRIKNTTGKFFPVVFFSIVYVLICVIRIIPHIPNIGTFTYCRDQL